MPNKHPNKKGWKLAKQRYKVSNWQACNNALRQRGNIEIWIGDDVINCWYEAQRIYDGTGTPKKFIDFAIMTCQGIYPSIIHHQ